MLQIAAGVFTPGQTLMTYRPCKGADGKLLLYRFEVVAVDGLCNKLQSVFEEVTILDIRHFKQLLEHFLNSNILICAIIATESFLFVLRSHALAVTVELARKERLLDLVEVRREVGLDCLLCLCLHLCHIFLCPFVHRLPDDWWDLLLNLERHKEDLDVGVLLFFLHLSRHFAPYKIIKHQAHN